MTLKLNGWQRLWILVSSIYLVIVCVYVVLDFPQPEGISHDQVFVKRLSPQSQIILVPKGKKDWQNAEDSGTDVDMPNGGRLSFKKGVPEKDMLEAVWKLLF